MNKPEISVVMVSGYVGGGEKSWRSLRGTLTALAQQDATVKVEGLLCEHKAWADSMPGGLGLVLPSMKLVLSDKAGEGWLLRGFTIRSRRRPGCLSWARLPFPCL